MSSEPRITYLFQNRQTDGQGTPAKVARKMQLSAEGTFDGATVVIKTRVSSDLSYQAIRNQDGSAYSITDARVDDIIDGLAKFSDIVAEMSGAGASTDVTVTIAMVDGDE